MSIFQRLSRSPFVIQWVMLGIALLAFGGFIGHDQYQTYQSIGAQEKERLSTQALIVEKNLVPQLLTASKAIEDIITEFPSWQTEHDGFRRADKRLHIIDRALSGTSPILVVDKHGTVMASSNERLIGMNFSHRAYFQTALKTPDSKTLIVSAPFKTVLDTFVITLGRVIPGPDGSFDGAVFISLIPEYFATLLDSVRYSPDMWTSIIHGDGRLFQISPGRNGVAGMEMIQPGTLFKNHLESGKQQNIFTGIPFPDDVERMMAIRTIQPTALSMDKPLIVAVTRDLTALYAPWRTHAYAQLILFAALSTVAVLTLLFFQRRQLKYALLEAWQDSERKQAEMILKESEEKFSKVFRHAPVLASITSLEDGTCIDVNEKSVEVSGYRIDEIIGRTTIELGWITAADRARMLDALRETGHIKNMDITFQAKGGRKVHGLVNGEQIAINGRPCLLSIMIDITERKMAEDRIQNLAFFDTLTGLPNRRFFQDQLKQAMASSLHNGKYCALFLIDLDNFKTLNDTLGHDKGDLLLQQVAKRLSNCIRDCDMLARLGGDEFVVLLELLSEDLQEATAQTETVGKKILAALNPPYPLTDHEFHTTPSIGITLFGKQWEKLDELLKRADLAMYQAKAAGRNNFCFYDPKMQDIVTNRVALEVDLREGLHQKQFLLYYQPQMEGSRLMGAEALLRWQHPLRGMVSPAEFIPLAEESGIILPLGHWVLQTACARLKAWEARPETADLSLSVNVSVRQFKQPDFVAQLKTTLANTAARPQKLKLELTESMLLEDIEVIIDKMTELKSLGVSFSLDDFGTGYSSLSYLKRLPFSQLKIDRTFVKDILTNANNASIAKTIVTLAQSLGLSVIAEGVETEEQRDFLLRHGCLAFQGFLFSRPLPQEEFERFA